MTIAASPTERERLRAEVEAARELFQRGRPAHSRQRFRLLRTRLTRLEAADPQLRPLLARTLIGLAAADFEVSGDFDKALALLDEAGEAARGSAELTASMHGQRGLLLLRRGETVAALAALDEAVGGFDDAPAYDRMTMLLNRGALHLDRGSLELAASDFARCLALAEQHGEAMLAWKARHNLGFVEFLAGRLPRALSQLEEAERSSPVGVSPVSLLDRARVLREAGLVRDADALLAKVCDLFAASRLGQDLGEAELMRAECALVEGEVADARAFAAAALRRFERRGNVRWRRRAELMVLRCDRHLAEARSGSARRTAWRGVAERAEALARACRREGRRDLARTAELVGLECRLLVGETDRPLPVSRSTDPLGLRLHAREVRALRSWRGGDHSGAAAEVRRGLGELGAYQHRFGSLDLRTASAVHGAALAHLGLRVALEAGSPAAVFHVVEQGRAISTRLPQVRPPSDERTAALLADLRQVEEEARGLEGEATAAERLEDLAEQGVRLQREIRARAWEIEGDEGTADAPPRLTPVREAAHAAGVAFVTYARHDGRWVAVSVVGRRAQIAELASMTEVADLVRRVRADLDALAMPGLPAVLRETVRRSLDGSLVRLDRLLLAPLRLGDRPLVASCSGDLMFLPWGLLPSRVGVSTVLTPSAAAWMRGRMSRRPVEPVVAAVAGPDLAHAAAEAAVVGATWPGARVTTGAQATTAAAHEALVSADLLHVAAHGRHRQDSPLFSSVRLADGHLYAYEVDPGDGLAGCVVLSACDAGLATPRPGEESLGLSAVLLQLGTRSVIAGVARVGDAVSAGIMRTVHRHLADGVDVASAVAAAQRESLLEGAPAGFVCLGDTW